jgi:hypothetical protein
LAIRVKSQSKNSKLVKAEQSSTVRDRRYADFDTEDDVQYGEQNGGTAGRFERHAGDEPLLDEGGKPGHNIDGLAHPCVQLPLVDLTDQHEEHALPQLAQL